LNQLKALPLKNLFRSWAADLHAKNTDRFSNQARNALLLRLSDEEGYDTGTLGQTVRELEVSGTLSDNDKADLMLILAESQSPAAVEILLDGIAAQSTQWSEESKRSAVDAVSMIGRSKVSGIPLNRDALTRVMAKALDKMNLSPDVALLSAFGQAFAQLGTELGTEASLSVYVRVRDLNAESGNVVAGAIERIGNADATKYLLGQFNNAAAEPDVRKLAGKALMHIGTKDSVEGVLDSVAKADKMESDLIAYWFGSLRTPMAQSATEKFLRMHRFQNEDVRNAIFRYLRENQGREE
jgi:HEAT repeat protein